MKNQCDNLGCTNPPVIGIVKDTPGMITTAAGMSKRIIRLCLDCIKQEERIHDKPVSLV